MSESPREKPTHEAMAESERLRRKIEDTSRAVLAFSRLFDLGALLQGIVEQACRLAEAEFGALGIVVSPDVPMNPWVYVGVPPEIAERIGRHPRPIGVLGEVAMAGHAVRVRELRRHPAFRGLPEHHMDVRSLLGVPIPFEGRSVGVLYLGNRRGADEFTAEDHHVIEILAAHAGSHLAKAQLRAQIAAERSQLQTILKYAPHGILHVGEDGRIVANPAADELLGQPLGGRRFEDYRGRLVRPDGSVVSAEDWPPSSPFEARVLRPDGGEAPVRVQATPVPGPSGELQGTVVVIEDIAPWKELERLREEFAAIIAHDLRNPVTTIHLQADQLMRGARGAEARVPLEALRRMNRAALRLGGMVNDLLDASRIEIRRLALDHEAVSLPAALASLLNEIGPSLGEHATDVRVEGEAPNVFVDRLRLDQILTNLVDNAAKYSPAGTPIHVTIVPWEGGALVSVADSGIGISAEEMPRLFDRFYQAKRAREKKSGLGLGLYITKGLVEAHGGRLWVDSAPGRGSTFHIWLPAAPAGWAEREAPPPGP